MLLLIFYTDIIGLLKKPKINYTSRIVEISFFPYGEGYNKAAAPLFSVFHPDIA